MIKIEVKGSKASVEAIGPTTEVIAELGAGVHSFYIKLLRFDPIAAKVFRDMFTDPTSPMFKE